MLKFKSLFGGIPMKPIFEYSDILHTPYEAFYFDTRKETFPILPHWHYFMEIIYMLEGSAYIEVENHNYVLEKGDLLVIHPQMNHAIYSTGQLPIVYAVLKFNASYLNIQSSHLPKLSYLLQMASETETLSMYFPKNEISHIPMNDLFEKCISIVEQKQFGYDVLAHSYYCIIMMELIKLWINQGLQLRKQPAIKKTTDSLMEILEYIDNHIGESLKIEELASMCNMSYSHFAKEFKRLYGQTCKDYILSAKIHRAEDLLQFTDYDLNYISQEIGFSDCSHFIKYFKQFHKITPKQYRMKYR